ncbi:MAG: hypothetical protein NVSMB7_00940 [Chitinophagaceae bacterium]
MADNQQQGELSRQLLTTIAQHVSPDTNYWGEFEQMNTESLIKAANACEKIIFSLKPEQFQTEQTMDISICYAAWMQKEGRTGNWKENYEYFLKNIYACQQQPSPLQNADYHCPATITYLKKAE